MSLVRVRRDGAIWTIVLDRPDARNALNRELQADLLTALDAFAQADEARVAILTGSDPAFCAGMDLRELGSGTLGFSDAGDYSTAMRAVGKPVIGAVNGAAVAGGLELVLACDFLIASERAWFADTHAVVGVLSGGGLSPYLVQSVGVRQARRMTLTGERVPAEAALACGLVTEVVPHELLLPRAAEVAAAIAARDTAVVAAVRASYERALNLPADEALTADAAASRAAGITTAHVQGVADRLFVAPRKDHR